jgi:hypothetical protein
MEIKELVEEMKRMRHLDSVKEKIVQKQMA